MSDRKLATVETVLDVRSIPDADKIEAVTVRGWTVVSKKGEFAVGDRCAYFEIDSHLDVTDPRFAFLAPRGVRTDAEGRSGHALKTAKLRGVVSQGLVLPLSDFPELAGAAPGDDVTEVLGVRKWEPPIPASIAGQVRGMRPSWIPKTDQERIQNIGRILQSEAHRGDEWIATLKIDGTSCSIGVDPIDLDADHNHVCSRNLSLKRDTNNTLWRLADEYDLHALISKEWPDHRAVVQGEAYGEGIQGNPLKVKGQHLRLFNVVVDREPLGWDAWPDWAKLIAVPQVPGLTFPVTVEQAVADVDGLKAVLNPEVLAEGVVWRHRSAPWTMLDDQQVPASWKVISNRYLLKVGG